jgi:hypothetical protein
VTAFKSKRVTAFKTKGLDRRNSALCLCIAHLPSNARAGPKKCSALTALALTLQVRLVAVCTRDMALPGTVMALCFHIARSPAVVCYLMVYL